MASDAGGLAGAVSSADEVLRPSTYGTIPLDDWVETVVKDWLVPNFRPAFRAAQWPVDKVLSNLNDLLQVIPFAAILAIFVLIAWRFAGRGVAIFTLVSLALLETVGLWSETMTTLSMILTAVVFCAAVGIPLGILAAGSDRFEAILRPILDIMQTIPPFVYLVPIVMLFGVGMVPGVIATIIFALPPIIRLTNLGIRQVRDELVEAGYAFGSTRRQVLIDIQIPLALRTIMAGLNQTLMLALSMAVIAALIGAGGLGLTVFTGLGRLDVGMAFLGGLGIVLLAIILDRITQAIGAGPAARNASWTLSGFFKRLLGYARSGSEAGRPSGQAAE
ncbi:proline/glycine betaine ABC transporter permease [Kaustia mangrovi]|uniref:Proline/glycine betaine ABC transporter permease n=1 Tax=Kaustia mangrovi TaxID=2593653 RepID=A0A7S8C497_9HYPH|nr:proline/glycine betaine ABC transporter permease [Kaustia mangrovi]QPC43068.1 proline/glycine betaine ABC transporter permease [Kaustia mangrovi]